MRGLLDRILGRNRPDPFDEAMRRLHDARPGEPVRLPPGVSVDRADLESIIDRVVARKIAEHGSQTSRALYSVFGLGEGIKRR